MSPRRFLATALVSSLGCYGLAPASASAESRALTAPGASLRASVDAAVGHAALPRPKKADGARMTTAADGNGGGGGGGGHVLLMVVGLAASAATAYFVIKQTKKQTGQTQ